jgi:two-component system nitrate/nitrite response regulator NarL
MNSPQITFPTSSGTAGQTEQAPLGGTQAREGRESPDRHEQHDVAERDALEIVICDDHGMFARGLAEALTGADVRAATRDPDRATRLVKDHRPAVCLMGSRYSGVERLDVLALVNRASPGTSVLLMATTPSRDVWRAFDCGQVAAIVSKACTLSVIQRSLDRVRRGERFTVGIDRPSAPPNPRGQVTLTAREREVLQLTVAGRTTREMSKTLGITVNTVRTHVQHMLDKLGVSTRVQAAQLAVEQHLLLNETVGEG